VVVFKRILCPIDFSPSSLQALGFALDLARQSNGTVTLLNVIEWLAEEEPMTSAHFNVPEVRGQMRQDAEHRLQGLVADEPRTWCEIDHVVGFGRAHREILRTAELKSSDLIVWVPRDEEAWDSHCSDRQRSRFCGVQPALC
jgi:nucleotide-binding universal stress UspA family protein